MPNNQGPMSGEPQLAPSLLERLDLALAAKLAASNVDQEPVTGAERFQDWLVRPHGGDAAWIASLLRLRGLVIFDDDVAQALLGKSRRLAPSSQEYQLARGLADVLLQMRQRAHRGTGPDGAFLVHAFETMTRGIPRFRGNTLRSDQPWDAILFVNYPAPDELQGILDTFDHAHGFRDLRLLYEQFHPVRQAFRLMWRFCRVAPFPDFNLVMGWIAMCAHLMSKGYPALRPELPDRSLVQKMVAGPPPIRLVQFEARLLEAVEAR
jgi:hypothetical protein